MGVITIRTLQKSPLQRPCCASPSAPEKEVTRGIYREGASLGLKAAMRSGVRP